MKTAENIFKIKSSTRVHRMLAANAVGAWLSYEAGVNNVMNRDFTNRFIGIYERYAFKTSSFKLKLMLLVYGS